MFEAVNAVTGDYHPGLLETPVRQCGRATRRLAQGEAVVASRFGPGVGGLDVALNRAAPSGASCLEERFNAGVALVTGPCGSFRAFVLQSGRDSARMPSRRARCSLETDRRNTVYRNSMRFSISSAVSTSAISIAPPMSSPIAASGGANKMPAWGTPAACRRR